MHVTALRALRQFWERHPDAEGPLRAWHVLVSEARWENIAELQAAFPKVSVLNNRRVVFNIGGNKSRLVVKVKYSSKTVFVRFIGTHSAYDRIDANEV
ncbi:MAG TPA: type II toxin-antitoxin system HigB family toxin [bacterium]|nr:type II toxin-antitoxin system HigB family toxin [bacterium]